MELLLPKNQMTEEDIRLNYITPALLSRGWQNKITMETKVRFTDGKINIRGNLVTRGNPKKADYILYINPNNPIAIVEAKKYTVQEIADRNYNIDLCGYPHEEEEILPPDELIRQYQEKRASLNADIDRILAQITEILGI